ncbi:MAG TPA: DUF4336 domain-containing protein [Burkholderiales bacterium]|jgi:hypothetical protein
MPPAAYRAYQPLGDLKPVAADVWIADGPEIRLCYGPLRMPFPTRMTVVRLSGGGVWVHSPIELDAKLAARVESLGRVAYLVAPNTIHYWWVRDWKERFPGAEVWSVPRLAARAQGRMPAYQALGPRAPQAWCDEIDQVTVEGSALMEAVFFHRPSATLIITDLIENFEDDRFESRFYRVLAHLGGVIDPDGRAPCDLRATFRRSRPQMRAAVERMIAWNPERVIIAHGRWYTSKGTDELKRAFRWVLG